MASASGGFFRARRGWRWLWAAGLGFPLLMGVVLVALVLIALSKGAYVPPTLFSAGYGDQYQVNRPVYFENERFWLVELESGKFVALYDFDPQTRCTVPWRPDYELMGRKGWFRDACEGSTYDLEGRCFAGPCRRGLDRLGVFLQSTQVIVKLTDLEEGPPVDSDAQPVNP
ncbi:MAG: hypothetical protein Q7T33_07705 [Dehalococcoidia bacterium]|nr:hypothetical protein [Dehalococcoidia bacterium]